MKKKGELGVIVHDWLSLPHNERLTEKQVSSFAETAKRRYDFPNYGLILDQISKHVGKSY